jgi:hypothetical protein
MILLQSSPARKYFPHWVTTKEHLKISFKKEVRIVSALKSKTLPDPDFTKNI